MDEEKRISPDDVLQKGYSFIKTNDGKLTLVDKDYNIILNDVENQPNLHDWIDNNSLWNKPQGLVETGKYNSIRNPEGMNTIRNSMQWGGNVAGAFAASALFSPIALEYGAQYIPKVLNYSLNKIGKPILNATNQLFNPTTYHGAALTSGVIANDINQFSKNPSVENGMWVGLSTVPIAQGIIKGSRDLAKTINSGIKVQQSMTTFNPNATPQSYQKAISVGSQTLPNHYDYFKYNAFLDSEFYTDRVKQIIKNFSTDFDINKVQQAIKDSNLEDANQLRNFLRSYNFSKEKVPYYSNLTDLFKDHPVLKNNYEKGSKQSRDAIDRVYNAVLDNGEDFGVLLKDIDQGTHEMEHVLQRKRWFPGSYLPEQENLLNKAYPHSKVKTEAHKILEKGAVNNQLRTLIIDDFKQKNGRYPSVSELQKYIDDFPNDQLSHLLSSWTNLYGREYVQNNANMKLVKQALKYIGVLTTPLMFNNHSK